MANEAARFNSRVETSLVRNVLIAGNQLSGQYWGRGITVVGGQSISIAKNTLTNVPRGAGVLVTREAGYLSFGVENVLIEHNLIRDVQTLNPPYDYGNKFASEGRTGHGAIEIQASAFQDEAADPGMRETLSLSNVLVRGNVIERAAVNASRAGVSTAMTMREKDSNGRWQERSIVSGVIRNIGFDNNRFNQVTGDALGVLSPDLMVREVYCSANQHDGNNYRSAACTQTDEPVALGAPLSCTADGLLQ